MKKIILTAIIGLSFIASQAQNVNLTTWKGDSSLPSCLEIDTIPGALQIIDWDSIDKDGACIGLFERAYSIQNRCGKVIGYLDARRKPKLLNSKTIIFIPQRSNK